MQVGARGEGLMAQDVSVTQLLERVARLEQQVTALQETVMSNMQLLDWLKQTVEANNQLLTLVQQMTEALRQAEHQTEHKLKVVEKELMMERAEHEDF
jgi:hypothetical protein